MRKFWQSFLVTVLTCLALTGTVLAAPGLVDQAQVLKPEEAKKISAQLAEVNKKYGINAGIIITKSLNGMEPGKFANNYLDQGKFAEAKNGGLVLLLNMQGHDWYIATDNKLRQAVTDKYGVGYLGTDVVNYMKKGKVAEACSSFVENTGTFVEHFQKTGKAYVEGDGPDDHAGIGSYLMALLGSLGLGTGVKKYLQNQMSNVATATTASAYVTDAGLVLTNNVDNFAYQDVVRVPKSSGSKDKASAVTTSSSDDSHGGGGGKW